MRLGVHLVNFSLPGGPETIGPTIAATGRAAEEAGLDNLSFMDHYFQLDFFSGAGEPMLEGYTALGFLAAHTSSVELQLLMTGVTYRHPGLLAKIVSTLDAPHLAHDPEGFLEPLEPLGQRRERYAEGAVLPFVPGCTDAEGGSPAGEHVEGRHDLGEQAGVAVRHTGHQELKLH